MPDNVAQLAAIHRYHRHLARIGRAPADVEQTARLWVCRFARLWRVHREHRQPA
jgi:hypothetical protein